MNASGAGTTVIVGGIAVRMIDDGTPAPRKASPPRERNECRGSRVALQGNPMSTPCPGCGRVFDPPSFLLRGSDAAFPPHAPKSEKRQAAAARARVVQAAKAPERERRIAADRVNHRRAAVAFDQWLRKRPSYSDAAGPHGFAEPWPGGIDHCSVCGQHSLHPNHESSAQAGNKS